MYVTNTELLILSNISHIWSFINNLKKNSGLLSNMKHNHKELTNLEEIANAFALHFQSSYSDHANIDLNRIGSVDFAATLSGHNFMEEEILEKLQKLDISKGAGPDGIPPILIKNCADSLLTPLLVVFQRSFDSGCFLFV